VEVNRDRCALAIHIERHGSTMPMSNCRESF
jgi:hypothetical protein